MRISDVELLHPVCRDQFAALAVELTLQFKRGNIATHFKVFETYRSPERQREVQLAGNSKAGPWSSPHQYGLACDFVPYLRTGWSWAVPVHEWDELRAIATKRGFLNNISWDRPHVEHPSFSTIIRPRLLERA